MRIENLRVKKSRGTGIVGVVGRTMVRNSPKSVVSVITSRKKAFLGTKLSRHTAYLRRAKATYEYSGRFSGRERCKVVEPPRYPSGEPPSHLRPQPIRNVRERREKPVLSADAEVMNAQRNAAIHNKRINAK